MLLTRVVRDEGDECDESFPECTALQGITRSFVIIWDYRYKNRSNFRVSRPPKLWKAGKVQRTHWRTVLLTGSPMFFQGQVSKMFTFGNIQVVIVACSLPCYQYCTLDIISYHPQQNQYTHIYIYVYILHIHTKGVGMGVLHVTKLLSAFSPSICKRPCLRRPRCGAAPRCLRFKSHQEDAMWCNGSIPHSLSAW